jgi:single-stranded DNA-binding protein
MLYNSLTIITGNIGSAPELFNTPNGNTGCKFSVCDNEIFKQVEGQPARAAVPHWHNVVAWDEPMIHNIAALKPGTRVTVIGQYAMTEWDITKTDGTPGKARRHEVRAASVGVDLRWASAVVTKNHRQASAPMPEPEGVAPQAPVPAAPVSVEQPF